MKRVDDYRDTILYKHIQRRINEGDLKPALKVIHGLTKNEYLKEYASLLDVLVEAYEGGDKSTNLVEKFKSTVDDMFQILQDQNLIHTGSFQIEGVDNKNDDSNLTPPISMN